MKFKYINQIEGVDHVLSMEIEKGADIKLNGKLMKHDDVLKPGDILIIKDKELIKRLRVTGLYEEVVTGKQTANEQVNEGD